MSKLTHVSDTGAARMVDVSAKAITKREAKAVATVHMLPSTLQLIIEGGHQKGGCPGGGPYCWDSSR